ncbi:MAG: hypothetical protein JWP63_4440 [Candidatus Solibacter sp.]|nr:hypothetical protein [Candidatus Solibacter sp.]
MLVVDDRVVQHDQAFPRFHELAQMFPLDFAIHVRHIVEHEHVDALPQIAVKRARVRIHIDLEIAIALKRLVKRNVVIMPARYQLHPDRLRMQRARPHKNRQ